MRVPTTAWNTAVGRTATQASEGWTYDPVLFLECVDTGRLFATRAGASAELEIARLENGGVGPLSVELNDADNSTRVSGTTVTLLNQAHLARTFTTVLDNMAVRVLLGFAGLPLTDALRLFSGVVDRQETTRERLTLDLIDDSFKHHRNLSIPVGGQYFPGAPQASRSSNIPIILGVNVNAPTIQIAGDALGTLAFALSTASTELYLIEFGAAFPMTGEISIATETGVTYDGRRLVTLRGATYLRLEGLVRGSPVTHTAAETVTLTTVDYIYLIGYELGSLSIVREDGVVLTSGYTYSVVTADHPVSILTFTTQRGLITVDTNAGNVDLTSLLTNGGWETGTNSSWTPSAGATVVIGSTAPDPEEGTYRLALTGQEDVYEDNYQEFTSIVGEDYRVTFSYLCGDVNLLTNGGFETGDLTGWTVDSISVGTADVLLAGSFVGFAGVAGLGQTAADGVYFLRIGPDLDVIESSYHVRMYQDVATTIGQIYVLTFRHVTQYYAATGGTIYYYWQTQAGIAVGTTTTPESLITTRFAPPGLSMFLGSAGWVASPSYFFVATATTTRITLIGSGIITSGVAPVLLLDAVRLQQADVPDVGYAGYQLGTPAVPGEYAEVDLPVIYQWTRQYATFRATDTTARVTLRSQYKTPTPRTAYFDAVTVERAYTTQAGVGGQNCIEAMQYIIDTFLPQASYDTDNVHAAYLKRLEWNFGTVLTTPGESRALLNRMAQQCHCYVFEDHLGQLTIVPRDEDRPVVWGFDVTANLWEHTVRCTPESIDNVYTEVYVWFGAKTGGSTNSSDFVGLTYATPTETTHPNSHLLLVLCDAALVLYGRVHRLDIYADFIQDLHTANLLLEATVRHVAFRHEIVTFATWLDAHALELGDMVQIDHPSLPGGVPALAEIVGSRSEWSSMQCWLTARVLRPAGWKADYEYPIVVLDSAGWAADYEP